ncbi:MAG: helix-turn-helix domain-containing protein [Dehalococcoidia bacterium]|nr:helix-turn-helix domain-containing protein [Dehalococcoidia bacterium]
MKKPKRRVVWDSQSIHALRQHLGLTQDEMAAELGTRQQTISEWERGMYQPRGASSTLLTVVAERARFPYQVKPDKEDKT